MPFAVNMPILTPCVSIIPAEPRHYSDMLGTHPAPVEQLKAILADRELMAAYAQELRSLLAACQ